MEPPSSDAEPLRAQQPAPVRAPHGLLVAADEAGHLEGRQQSVGQTELLAFRVCRQCRAERPPIPSADSSWSPPTPTRWSPVRSTAGGEDDRTRDACAPDRRWEWRTSREAPRVGDGPEVDHRVRRPARGLRAGGPGVAPADQVRIASGVPISEGLDVASDGVLLTPAVTGAVDERLATVL